MRNYKALFARLILLTLLTIMLFSLVLFPPNTIGSKSGYTISEHGSAFASSRGEVIIVEMNVPIDAGSSGMVARAVSEAQSSAAAAVIINMNTPGGLLSDMVSIVDSIGNSSAPVYAYVGNNSLAASAGSYIAMASEIIFMGPGSEIGPSTPIVEGGSALQQNHTGSAMLLFMSALAQAHNRNFTAASNMVLYDIAYSQQEALQFHVADRSSNSLAQTISDLNLSGAAQVTISETPSEQLLSFLSDPTVDGILLLLGILAIAIDFFHPTILLSVAGGVLIVLALIGAESIQGAGTPSYSFIVPFVLFAVAATLIVFEIKTGHGYFLFTGVTVGAIATFLIAYQVPYSPSPYGDLQYIEVAVLLVAGALLALYSRWVSRSIRKKPMTGPEAMTGKLGYAYTDLNPNGSVSVDGVIWNATLVPTSAVVKKGDALRIMKVNGLTLVVEPESIKEKVS